MYENSIRGYASQLLDLALSFSILLLFFHYVKLSVLGEGILNTITPVLATIMVTIGIIVRRMYLAEVEKVGEQLIFLAWIVPIWILSFVLISYEGILMSMFDMGMEVFVSGVIFGLLAYILTVKELIKTQTRCVMQFSIAMYASIVSVAVIVLLLFLTTFFNLPDYLIRSFIVLNIVVASVGFVSSLNAAFHKGGKLKMYAFFLLTFLFFLAIGWEFFYYSLTSFEYHI